MQILAFQGKFVISTNTLKITWNNLFGADETSALFLYLSYFRALFSVAHGPPGGAFRKLPLQAGKPTSLGEKALFLQFPTPVHVDVAFCCMALRLS